MSHFAKVVNGVVTQVIVAEQDVIDDRDGQWVQTSYNTRGGVHYAPNSNDPDGGIALRKNYAGIEFSYDAERDAFIPQQPFPSWTLNETTCLWNAPVTRPSEPGLWVWNEETLAWIEYT